MPSYEPPTLHQLIYGADKIVYGTVVCMDATSFEVACEKTINHDDQTIRVRKFTKWNCGKRWADYELGQRSIFFLRLREDEYDSGGGGNEGELPIHDGSVYVHKSTLSQLGTAPWMTLSDRQQEDHGYNNPYNGYVLELDDFWHSIQILKSCWTVDKDKIGRLINIERKCPPSSWQIEAETNDLLEWAITRLES